MLRANVGLSRKVTRDFQSTGYSVNLDGEIPFNVDDADGVIAKVKELFDLAQESLHREIDRDQGESAIGRRDEESPAKSTSGGTALTNGPGSKSAIAPTNQQVSAPLNAEQTQPRNGTDEAATNKQLKFILTMGKRFNLSTPQLEIRIGQIVGRNCGVYELTKKEAGRVLDELTGSLSEVKQLA